MAGKKFAVAIKLKQLTLQEPANNELNLKKLDRGRIDFYLNDKLIDTSKFPNIKRRIVTKNNWGYVGFTRKDFEFNSFLKDLKIKFNEAVKEAKKSGEIAEIVKKYKK